MLVQPVGKSRTCLTHASSTSKDLPLASLNALKRRPAYWYNSRRRYFIKSNGIAGLFAADLFWIVGATIGACCRLLKRRSNPHPRWHTFDILWGDTKAILNGSIFRIRRETPSR